MLTSSPVMCDQLFLRHRWCQSVVWVRALKSSQSSKKSTKRLPNSFYCFFLTSLRKKKRKKWNGFKTLPIFTFVQLINRHQKGQLGWTLRKTIWRNAHYEDNLNPMALKIDLLARSSVRTAPSRRSILQSPSVQTSITLGWQKENLCVFLLYE